MSSNTRISSQQDQHPWLFDRSLKGGVRAGPGDLVGVPAEEGGHSYYSYYIDYSYDSYNSFYSYNNYYIAVIAIIAIRGEGARGGLLAAEPSRPRARASSAWPRRTRHDGQKRADTGHTGARNRLCCDLAHGLRELSQMSTLYQMRQADMKRTDGTTDNI